MRKIQTIAIFIWLIFSIKINLYATYVPINVVIETESTGLLLRTNQSGRLTMLYLGSRLNNIGEYDLIYSQTRFFDNNSSIQNLAYTPSGTVNLSEPALRITHQNGNNSTDLFYQKHTVKAMDENTVLTTIHLKDSAFETEVLLYYKAYFKENVIEQWTEIRNSQKENILLEKYASANLYLSGNGFYLHHYAGGWANEMRAEETKLTHGIKVLDSKLGTRAHLFQPPSFLVSIDGPAQEETGKVLLATLAWSGNFQTDLEIDSYNNLRIVSGIGSYAAEYPLKKGASFITPPFIFTFSEQGKGQASRNMHQWARKYGILDGQGERITILNNWESTFFDFDQQKLSTLFKDGKKLGLDVFLLDDGWFGNKYPRNDDKAGLGDWKENKKKLPGGLAYLAKEATACGIKFGIWIEPEMVNPKSELYEKHPDWVIKQPDRPEAYMRDQLVLDLTNPKVQDFIFETIDSLFIKAPSLAFIKWDCNSVIFNAYSPYLQRTGQKQSQLFTDYVRGLYKVLDRIRSKYPKVPMMLCSGGGGRVDYGALKYFTEYWLSDNTDPLERIFIQYESSYFFPLITHCNHVTDWSKSPIKFRIDVAMMGKLGFDIDVYHLSPKEMDFCIKAVENYNRIKDVVWHGNLYRLKNPSDGPIASLMTVSQNKKRAVLFSYLVSNRFNANLSPNATPLKGLDASKKYRVKEINDAYVKTDEEGQVFTGDFLLKNGISLRINRWKTSTIFEITEEL